MGEEASSVTRQRKKRKWDQPAEVVPAAMAFPGLHPFNAVSGFTAMGFPGIFPSVGAFPTLATTGSLSSIAQVSAAVSAVQHQNAAAIVQKINQDLKGVIPQPKIQDELIAREIVINDAESGIRYKLTKRQTQEEIQSKTGAVVITRGRYKPPGGAIDGEKPLYLHISAGVHLKDTAERIKAVDQAAAIVEEMLKQGRQLQSGLSSGPALYGAGSSPFTNIVYAGCDADSSFNLVGRIRGPNDQYLNHIMKETGAAVVLRGKGSGSIEELSMPLHLYISCDNAKGLDDANRLAENLLETIRSEHALYRSSLYQVPLGITNVSSQPAFPSDASGSLMELSQSAIVGAVGAAASSHSQLSYAAVPPPKQLSSDGTSPSEELSSGRDENVGAVCPSTNEPTSVAIVMSTPGTTSAPLEAYSSVIHSSSLNISHAGNSLTVSRYSGNSSQMYPLGLVQSFCQNVSPIVPQSLIASAATTSYSGYGGIYPQASPLQQVAMALQRPPPSLSIKGGTSSSMGSVKASASSAHAKQQEKQPCRRRKFQEFPVTKESSKNVQDSLTVGSSRLWKLLHEAAWFPCSQSCSAFILWIGSLLSRCLLFLHVT